MTVSASVTACPANIWNHTSGCTCTSNGSVTAEAGHVDLLAGTAYDTRPQAMQMGEDEFDQMFGGTVESPDGVAMWTQYPGDVDDTIAKDRIWTVIEGDGNENLYLAPGNHAANRLAWVVTEEAWGNPNIEVLWHDEHDMYDEERDGPWENPGPLTSQAAAPAEPTADQTYCDVDMHQQCSGYTEDESDPESCMCNCHTAQLDLDRANEAAAATA